MIWKPLYLLFILCIPWNVLAQADTDSIANKYFTLTDSSYISGLESYIQILRDPGGKLTLEEVRKTPNLFLYENPYYKNYSSNTVYWVKFNVYCSTYTENQKIIQAGYASDISLYFIQLDSIVTRLKIGYLYPHHDRKYQYGVPSGSSAPYTFKDFDTTEVYIRYQESIHKTLNIFPNFKNLSGYLSSISERNLYQGIFQGIIIMMILYHLLLFFILGDFLFVYFASYLFFILVTFLFPFTYLWRMGVGSYFWIHYHIICWAEIGATVFYLMFIKNFIQTHKSLPKWDKALKIIIGLSLLAGVFSGIYYQITLNTDTYFFITNIFTLVAVLFSILILFPIYRLKNKLYFYYIWGTTAVGLCIFIGITMLITKIYYQNFQQNIIQIGVILQIVIFALGIGKKIKVNEDERRLAQDGLIEQLKENEQLQTKVNRELEEKVKERTWEIEQQKEEIKAQSNNLEEANVEITLQKNIIEKAHNNMTDSIRYALRIQEAVLPKSEDLHHFNSKHFIFYRPRDIVSGDFYFFEETKSSYIIAAADCTGHGVPGAFMSMLGVTLLNEIIRRDENLRPNEILNHLRKGIKASLRQTGAYLETQDGMDMALCVINKTDLSMDFAGAHNPLILFRNNQMIEYPADRMPISIYLKERPFTNANIKLMSGDRFYIFSDGYFSQFNGRTNEKFKTSRFKKLLHEIHLKPMESQKSILAQTFDDWKNNGPQTDDVLIIGIQIA